jgi:hypothetical protein
MKQMKKIHRPKGVHRCLVQAKKGLGRSAGEVFVALKLDARDKFVSEAARRILERSEWSGAGSATCARRGGGPSAWTGAAFALCVWAW